MYIYSTWLKLCRELSLFDGAHADPGRKKLPLGYIERHPTAGLDPWERGVRHLQHLLRYADEGDVMLNRIVTGDESWVHHYQPESKCVSVQWKDPRSPSTKKFKVANMPSAGKVMLTVF
jgi:hypothetical protein